MDIGSVLLATLVSGIILFFWGGFTQNVLPWGIKSVRQTGSEANPVGESIGAVLTDGMMYVKHRVAAFIAVRPESYYATGRYFAIEFITQLLTGAALTGLLVLTRTLPPEQRLLVVGLAALATLVSVDLQYWNWWGFSTRYTLGIALNRLVGHLLAAGVVLALILR